MNILSTKLVVGVTVVVVIFLLVSLAQEMNRRFQIQRQAQQLEEEVQALEKSVIELENLNQYFRTADYQERLAREKLSYQAPGEQLVLVPDAEFTADDVARASAEAGQSIPEQWWRLIFVSEDSVLQLLQS